MCTWLLQGGQRRESQKERERCRTSLIYTFLPNLMQALSRCLYFVFCNLFPLLNTDFSSLNSKIFLSFFLHQRSSALTADLTSSVCRGNGEEGHWRFWCIVSAPRRDGPPRGRLPAQCAVSQNIMTCHKLLYKEGSLHVLFNMLSYSQSVSHPPPFQVFSLCLPVHLTSYNVFCFRV